MLLGFLIACGDKEVEDTAEVEENTESETEDSNDGAE
jgi:hypothetical protein